MTDHAAKLREAADYFGSMYDGLADELLAAANELDALAAIRELVNRQAEDAGLWFVAETCAEAYLQQELRKLHAAIEAVT